MDATCIKAEHQIVRVDDLGNRCCVYRKQLGSSTEPWGPHVQRDGVGVGFGQGRALCFLLFIMEVHLISWKVSEQEEMKTILCAEDLAVVADSKE